MEAAISQLLAELSGEDTAVVDQPKKVAKMMPKQLAAASSTVLLALDDERPSNDNGVFNGWGANLLLQVAEVLEPRNYAQQPMSKLCSEGQGTRARTILLQGLATFLPQVRGGGRNEDVWAGC